MSDRYDYMVESNVLDEDGQKWPDPLINYNDGALTTLFTEYQITERDLSRFWVCMMEQYGTTNMDDLWLNINGIPYLMMLKPGDMIYKVAPADLTGFHTNKKIGHEYA
jgi:hypothetical protein